MLESEVPPSDEGDELEERASGELERRSSDSELDDDEDDDEGEFLGRRVASLPRRLVAGLRLPWCLGEGGSGEGWRSSSELLVD